MRYDLRRGTVPGRPGNFHPRLRGQGARGRRVAGALRQLRCSAPIAAGARSHGYLETGRYGASVPYLCAVAAEGGKFKQEWRIDHRRYFEIAGITSRVESDVSLREHRLFPALALFAVAGPGARQGDAPPSLRAARFRRQGAGQGTVPEGAVGYFPAAQMGTLMYRGIPTDGSDQSAPGGGVQRRPPRHIYGLPRNWKTSRNGLAFELSLFPTDQFWLDAPSWPTATPC